MENLRQLLFDRGRVGKVLEALRKQGLPDPLREPGRALLLGHALCLYGDFQQALKVFSAIPTGLPEEPERLWGLANAHLSLGDLKQVEPLLNEALGRAPSDWLIPHLYNTLVNLHATRGQFELAQGAIEKGLESTRDGKHLIVQLILEGNRGILKAHQGAAEEAAFLLERAVSQLLARDSILSAANFLINLSNVFDVLGAPAKAERCLSRAEGLTQESGSMVRLVFLKLVQGDFLKRKGQLTKAEMSYEEALSLLKELPMSILEAYHSCELAQICFAKGDLATALRLVRKTLNQVREKGLHSIESHCLAYEGEFLLHAGATEDGLRVLARAGELAESMGKWEVYSHVALFLALGHEKISQRGKAIQWLARCFEVTERCRMLPALLEERDTLIPLLLKLGGELTPSEFLSRLIIQLRHPALLKHLLRHSPGGKVLFLRSLKVQDARHFKPLLERLQKEPAKEVRQTARLLLKGWHQHANYRVHTFGALRLFFEGRMFEDKDWVIPGVKRLFLYFVTHPEKWHALDSLLDALWNKPQAKKTRKVLYTLFYYLRSVLEPWHLSGMDYVFLRRKVGSYGFFPGERFWIDYQEFERGIKKAEKDQLARNFKEARKAYREALNLYLGDYLEEFPYEDWLRPKRDYLRELYFRGAMRYAALERDSGNPHEARRILEEALFKDLSRSDCITLLIQVLSQMKLTQQAKDWGDRHVKYLRKELREKPAPEVVEALSKLG